MSHLSLDDFSADPPTQELISASSIGEVGLLIDGVRLTALVGGADKRGQLNELLSLGKTPSEPIVHVYQVRAAPGSVRAWLLHKLQADRLAFTNGTFQVVLHDLRQESPTYGMTNSFVLGEERIALLRIPPFVVHGVKNIGKSEGSFVNIPTRAYDPLQPDKYRLPVHHPKAPFTF